MKVLEHHTWAQISGSGLVKVSPQWKATQAALKGREHGQALAIGAAALAGGVCMLDQGHAFPSAIAALGGALIGGLWGVFQGHLLSGFETSHLIDGRLARV